MNAEIFYQTVNLFEQALNKKIILNISRTAETGQVSISTNPVSAIIQNPYKLTIPYEGVGISSNQQDSYAILHHELSHIIFGSTSKVVVDFFKESKHEKLKEISNILEDQRIEDCLGKLYIGTYQDLQIIKPRICQEDPCIICKSGKQMPTIAHMLLGLRSGILKLCSNPNKRCLDCQKANDMVLGGKSIKATFVALKLLEKYIDEELQENGNDNKVSDPSGNPIPINPAQIPIKFENFDNKIEDNLNVESKDLTEMDQTMEELIEDSVDEFLDQLKDVQKCLNQNSVKKEKVFRKIIDNQVKFLRDKNEYKPDPRIKQLRKYFKDLKYKEQQKGLDEGGEILDIDSLISNKIDHNGEIFQNIENIHGLEVTYLVDVSGSMASNGSLQIAKQALIDMVELSKGLFDIKVFAFSGSSTEPTISLVQQIPINKITELNVNMEYAFTHTHHGVQIASEKFSGVSTKKVLIIITDGMPCCCKYYTEADMDRFTKKAIENARKSGIKVYTIISGNDNDNERIFNIFGKESTISKIKDVNNIYKIMKDSTIRNLLKTIKGG